MKKPFIFILFCVFFLAGCQPGGVPQVETTSLPVETSRPSAAPAITEKDSQDPVKIACGWSEQMEAVQSDSVNMLEAIEIPACYDLSFILSPVDSSFKLNAAITVTNNTEESWPVLVFRLFPNASNLFGGKMEVDDVAMDGQEMPFEIFLPDQTGLRIDLIKPLEPGSTASVSIQTHGDIPRGLSSQNVYGIFSNFTDDDGRMLVLADAYPILAVWSDGSWQAEPVQVEGDAVTSNVSLYHVEVNAPQGWRVITTGVEIASQELAETATHEITTGPVRDFFMVLSPDLVLSESKSGEVTIRHWALKNSLESQDKALQVAQKSLEWYEKTYGGYPFNELDVIQSPMQYALGVEYPGAILINAAMYSPSNQYHDRLETTIAHEVAHQWWYSTVGNDVIENPWMDEALTSYSSLAYLREYDAGYYSGTLNYYENRLSTLPKDLSLGFSSSVPDFHTSPELYGPLVYLKGSLFFLALEEKIGTQIFDSALRDYYTQNAFVIAEPEELLGSFSAACACNLDSFFQEWGVKP